MEMERQKSNQKEERKTTQAERSAMRRAANLLEHRGYYAGYATGALREIFDIIADSRIQDPSKDAGAYVRIAIEQISREELERIRNFKTPRKKELWILLKSSEKKNDPGHFVTPIQFDGTEIVQTPENRLFVDILKTMSRAGKSKRAPAIEKLTPKNPE